VDHIYQGRAYWIFPADFDVDQIVGIQNIAEYDYDKLISRCMNLFDESFVEKSRPGDILVAGKNFGAGHPHSQGMAVMRKLGINVVLAESFNFAFYRSELTEAGMVLLQVPHLTEKVSRFDRLTVDFTQGTVANLTKGETLQGRRPSSMEIELVETKSLLNFIASHLPGDRKEIGA
jgi:3-isopropylmalate/(R)-2-methylmalate dehydratase small subunit